MTTGHVFIAASLDGYIARPDGDVSWLTPKGAEAEDHGYDAFYASIDGIVMGRGTWDLVSRFDPWPYDKPVIVLSAQMTQSDIALQHAGRVTIWNAPPSEVMRRLADQGWRRAYIDGGKVVQSFLAAGLIADMVVTRIPVLLGDGIPLFGRGVRDIPLIHQRTQSFASGLVQSHYRIGQ
jgi:dihydrofolate reductase